MYGNITCKILDFHMDYYQGVVGELSNPDDPICQLGEAQAAWLASRRAWVTE